MVDLDTDQPEPTDAAGNEGLTGDDLDALIAGAAGDSGEQPHGSAQRASDGDAPPPEAPAPAGSAKPPGSSAASGRPQPAPAGSFDLPDLTVGGAAAVDARRITMLSDVKLNVKIELGRARMLVEDVLKLNDGSVVELDKPAGDPVEVYVNERLVARGEVLVLNDNFCVRISEVLAADPHRVSV
jgi:flagellar motor switch protein FliN/FliY